MTTARNLQFTGLCMIVLVLSLPFYSASALAESISITANAGQKNIEHYLDANSDVWRVEATISDAAAPTVDPTKVKIKIGNNERSFNSCTAGQAGAVCEYISPLTDGVQEREVAFEVQYEFINAQGLEDQVSNSDFIRADGTAPKITINSVQQNREGSVTVDFIVTERVNQGAPFVGLKLVEIIDTDSGTVLQTLGDFEPQTEQALGPLHVTFTGEGFRHLEIRAVDRLDHSAQSRIAPVNVDFVPPLIKIETLNFTQLGEFIGDVIVTTDVAVDIVEKSNLDLGTITAFSEQASLNGQEADCNPDDDEEGVWHCLWRAVEVQPQDAITVKVVSKDLFGNTQEKTRTIPLTKDTSKPAVAFFGTEHVFEGKSYIKSGENKIILRVAEQGAGISIHNIRANMLALGGGSQDSPTACALQGSTFECFWIINKQFSSDGVVRIGLTKFEDNVRNQGDANEVELFVDTFGPKVEELSIFGVSDQEKDYFQSNDRLKLDVVISESSGVRMLLNLNNVVMDAESKFPAVEGVTEAGWQVFDERSCERQEGKWHCSIETDAIKSGPDTIQLEIKVQDTAGNNARQWPEEVMNAERFSSTPEVGTISFAILGLSEETNPDYWEVSGKPQALIPFVDLDTVELIPARMTLGVRLRSSNSQAEALNINVLGCEPLDVAPELQRHALLAGVSGEGTASPYPKLVLEFTPFNGREFFNVERSNATFVDVKASYTCQLQVYSKVGSQALKYAEVQDVIVEVPFAFSELGSLDENLAVRVKDLKENSLFKIANALSYVDIALKWLTYIVNWAQILVTVNQFVNLFSDTMVGSAFAAEKAPSIGTGVGAALRGQCLVAQEADKELWNFLKFVQIPAQILSCNPGAFGENGLDFGPYYYWQNNILKTYNLISGRSALGIPADTLYENMYTSLFGLCVPGILYNINKAREVHCRKIICYGQEVPAGIATFDSCDKLYDLQMCEFVWGPVLDLTPLGGIGYFGKLIQSALSSPVGLITLTEVFGCAVLCFDPTPPKGAITVCKVATGLNKVVTIINSIVTNVQSRPDVTGSPYCKIAEEINVEDLIGAGALAEEDVETQKSDTAEEVTES